MLPVFYFPHQNDTTNFLAEKCKGHGYKVILEKPDWKKWNTFFVVTHDLVVHGEFQEPVDLHHFICVIMYYFCIDDEKDHRVLENYFSAFLSGREYFFPRCAGLLRHFVDPKLEH